MGCCQSKKNVVEEAPAARRVEVVKVSKSTGYPVTFPAFPSSRSSLGTPGRTPKSTKPKRGEVVHWASQPEFFSQCEARTSGSLGGIPSRPDSREMHKQVKRLASLDHGRAPAWVS